MSLKWEGFRENFVEALKEVIILSLSCLGITTLLIIYFKVFYCGNVTNGQNKSNKIIDGLKNFC